MKLLEDKILKDGRVINNEILKVDNFVNHQIDVKLMNEFAKEVRKHYKNKEVTKILTIETSGIAVAYAVSEAFNSVPVLFAKKNKSKIVDENIYTTKVKSFTKNQVNEIMVSKEYLTENENILIVDDFLAEGNAGLGLIDLCQQAHANIVGFVAVIEKTFQGGRKRIEDKGIEVFSGARIKAFKDNKPVF